MTILHHRVRIPAAAVAALCAVLALLWPAAAGAATTPAGLVLSGVRTDGGRLSLQVTPTHVPPGSTVDASALTVRVGDQRLAVQAAPAIKVTDAPTRVFDVVLDAGRDQSETPYVTGAREAAKAVAASLPPDVSLGLVVLGAGGISQPLAPTLDRAAFNAAVAAVRPGGRDDAVDGVDAAARALAAVVPSVDRRILVISDGANVFASAFHTRIGTSVAAADIGLDVLAVGAEGTGLTGLRLMAEARAGGCSRPPTRHRWSRPLRTRPTSSLPL